MRESVIGVARQVWRLFIQGIDLGYERRRRFESELKDLMTPHLAVLTHRRTKLLDTGGPERWSAELDAFICQNLWPFLGDDLDYAKRNRAFMALILDVAIEREQRRNSLAGELAIPLVSRFDTSWAS